MDLFELIDHISKPFTSSDDDIYGPSEIAEKVEIRFLDNVDIPLYYWSNEIDASERVACLRSFLKIDPNIRGDVESFLYFHYQHDISEACYSDFKDAEDYWAKASCKPFLKDIKVKSFLLIAENDPFLSRSCIPIEIAKNHFYLNVEVTKKGGHIGFIKSFKKR